MAVNGLQARRAILLFTCLALASYAAPQIIRVDPDIVGVWQTNIPGNPYPLVFTIEAGGKCGIEDDVGTCQAQGGVLVFRSASSGQNRYSYKLQDGKLTLTGGDLAEAMVFRRATGAAAAAPKGPFEAAREKAQADRTAPAGGRPTAPQPETPRQAPPGAGSAGGARYQQESWGLSFSPPSGWKVVDRDVALLLGSDTEPGLMLVRFERQTNAQALSQNYAAGLVEEGMRLMPATRVQESAIGKYRALEGELAGLGTDGSRLRARIVAVLTPFGDAAIVLGVTTEEKYASLKLRVDALATTFSFSQPKTPPVNLAIAGQYAYYYSSSVGSYSRQDLLSLCSNGTFTRGGEFYTSNSSGALASQSGNAGRWTAAGDLQGVITLTYNNGRTQQLQYRKAGVEIILDGQKYGRYGDGSCRQPSPF